MNYGPLLRATREHRGLTQEQVADEIGLTRSVVTKMEQGKVGLLLDRAVRWFEITQTQKVLELISTGVEVSVIISSLSTLLGGLILWM